MPRNVLYLHHAAQISWAEHSLQLPFRRDGIVEQDEATVIKAAGRTTDAA